MKKPELILYNIKDIKENTEEFIHKNAFIRPSGEFYLAKGQDGCNPWHQMESSALAISRKDIAHDIRIEYKEVYEKSKPPRRLFFDYKTILVHYYGYVFFARVQGIDFGKKEYIDVSLVPNPAYYGKEITTEQIETLEELFKINDDEMLSLGRVNPTSNHILKKVLTHTDNQYYHH